MSEQWSATPPSAQEFPATPATPADATAATLRRMAQEAREASRNLLRSAGITVAEALLTISRGLLVAGDLESTGSTKISGNADISGTTHIGGSTDIDGTLNVDADATFGGTMKVTGDAVFEGDLDVPNGSIGNDALASPVVPTSFRASATAFAVPGALSTVATQTVTVPAGFTKCAVTMSAYWRIINTSGVGGFVTGRPVINGLAGDDSSKEAPASSGATDSGAGFGLITGLTPGGTFEISAQVAFSIAMGAHANNLARVSGLLFWFR